MVYKFSRGVDRETFFSYFKVKMRHHSPHVRIARFSDRTDKLAPADPLKIPYAAFFQVPVTRLKPPGVVYHDKIPVSPGHVIGLRPPAFRGVYGAFYFCRQVKALVAPSVLSLCAEGPFPVIVVSHDDIPLYRVQEARLLNAVYERKEKPVYKNYNYRGDKGT